MEFKFLIYGALIIISIFYTIRSDNIKKFTIFSVLIFVLIFIMDSLNLPSRYFETTITAYFLEIISTRVPISEVIALGALAFTLFTYNQNTRKGKLNRDEDRTNNTFFKLLDMIIEKSNAISEDDVNKFMDIIQDTLSSPSHYRNVDLHKAFKFKEILTHNIKDIECKLIGDENNQNLFEKIKYISTSTNKEDFWRFLTYDKIRNKLNVSIHLKRKPNLTIDEFNTLESTGVIDLLSHKYDEKKILDESITYHHAFTTIDNKLHNNRLNNNGDFFRLIHRAIKVINDSNIEDKNKYYGILRAMLPDYLLVYIYYNCVYTSRGIGLGLQLIGTSFFGDEDDFSFKSKGNVLEYTQHIPNQLLIFKRQDPTIMINLFSKEDRKADYDVKKYTDYISSIFSETKVQFRKSFVSK